MSRQWPYYWESHRWCDWIEYPNCCILLGVTYIWIVFSVYFFSHCYIRNPIKCLQIREFDIKSYTILSWNVSRNLVRENWAMTQCNEGTKRQCFPSLFLPLHSLQSNASWGLLKTNPQDIQISTFHFSMEIPNNWFVKIFVESVDSCSVSFVFLQ